MENKYNELERLSQLKANGTITDTEFEIEKYKILNSKSSNVHTKKNKSKSFFILSSIGIVISIVLGIIYYFWQAELYTDIWFKFNNITLNNTISKILDYGLVIVITSSIVLLVLGIIFKIKEKGGIEIVN